MSNVNATFVEMVTEEVDGAFAINVLVRWHFQD